MNPLTSSGLPGMRRRFLCVLTVLLLGLCQFAAQCALSLRPASFPVASSDLVRTSNIRRAPSKVIASAGIAQTIWFRDIPDSDFESYSGNYLSESCIFYWQNGVQVSHSGVETVLTYDSAVMNYPYFGFQTSGDPVAAVKIYLAKDRVNNAELHALYADNESGYFYYTDTTFTYDLDKGIIYWYPTEGYNMENIFFYVGSGKLSVTGLSVYTTGRVPADFFTTDDSGEEMSVSPPVFSPVPGDFAGSATVTIQAEPGADIYFTTDGSTPTVSEDFKYNGPVVISASTTFKAIAVKDGKESGVTTAAYTNVRHGIGEGYNPTSPGNPGGEGTITVEKKYRLVILTNPDGAGQSYSYVENLAEGEQTYVYTYNNTGFKFRNWTIDGKEVSATTSFYYIMPNHDVTIVANYVYDPSSPGNPSPEDQKVKHPVMVRMIPSEAGSVSPDDSFSMVEGEQRRVYAYPNTGWKLVGWTVNGEERSEKTTRIDITMGESALDVVAYMEYDPSSPGNPATNYYNPTTGQVIIDSFQAGSLQYTIQGIVGSLDDVRSLIVIGEVDYYDYNNLSNLSNASTIDFSRTYGISGLSTVGFQNKDFSSIMLPSTISSIGSNVFSGCSRLVSLTIYASEPPVCNSNTFKNFTNKDNCTVYVPEQSVELYLNADYWRDLNIQPIPQFAQIGEVIPEDPDGWNDLSRPHRISIQGVFVGSDQNGRIEYSVDKGKWFALTDELEAGSDFSATLAATFNPELPSHTIELRMVDVSGNVSMLDPIVYQDVNSLDIQGIEDKTYDWGVPIVQESIACDMGIDKIAIGDYRDNVNVGKASVEIEGVYPYTIGRKKHYFNILPLALSGDIVFIDENPLAYSGQELTPEWRFSIESFNSMSCGQDFIVEWSDNVLPGHAKLRVMGKDNFCGEISASFEIDKAELSSGAYILSLPAGDITFDDMPHAATATKVEGVGDIVFSYALKGSESFLEEAPKSAGCYDVYVSIGEGALFYGLPLTKAGSFNIYEFDSQDWAIIQSLVPYLKENGWKNPWNVESGISNVSSFSGLSVKEGKVVGISLSGQGITGAFPMELLTFENLDTLDISDNSFDGALESIAALVIANPEKARKIERLDISNNDFCGNIGIFAQAFPSLVCLEACGNHISEVVPMISPQVKTLKLGSQQIDTPLEINLEAVSYDDVLRGVPTILAYNHSAQRYDDFLRLICSTKDGWSIEMLYDGGSLSVAPVSQQNAYYGKSGDLVNAVSVPLESYQDGHNLQIRLFYPAADANFDGRLSILDLQCTILYVFEEYDYYPFNYMAADTYPDNRINVQDVVCTANLLLEKASSTRQSTEADKLPSAIAFGETAEAFIYIEGDKLYLESSRPVAALDLTIDGSAEWSLETPGFSVVSKNNHLVGYSLQGVSLPIGVTLLGHVSKESRILCCELSDENAEPINVKSNVQGTVGLGVTGNDMNDDDIMIYDVNGLRSSNLGKGINIIVNLEKNEVKKVITKN